MKTLNKSSAVSQLYYKSNKTYIYNKNPIKNLNIPVNSPVSLHPDDIGISEAGVHRNIVPARGFLQFLVAAVQFRFDELARFAREHLPRRSVLVVSVCRTV